MISSLFYKEWIKTRRVLLLVILVFACFIIYTFINTGQIFRVSGAVQAWTDTLLKDLSLWSKLEWLPLFAGIVLGLAQYVPELTNKRLKLTLHLPLSEHKIIFVMLAYGLLCLLVLFAVVYGVMVIGSGMYYASEIVYAQFLASLPWFLAGLTGYVFVAWICLEPVWKYRIIYALIAVISISFFMMGGKSGAYIPFIPYLIILLVVACTFPFYSMYRFKDGAQ